MGLDFNVSLEPSEKAVEAFKAESKRVGPDKWLACIRELNNALAGLVSDAGLVADFDPSFFSDHMLQMRYTEDLLKSFCDAQPIEPLPGEANRLLTGYVARTRMKISDAYLAAAAMENDTLVELLARTKRRIADAVHKFES